MPEIEYEPWMGVQLSNNLWAVSTDLSVLRREGHLKPFQCSYTETEVEWALETFPHWIFFIWDGKEV